MTPCAVGEPPPSPRRPQSQCSGRSRVLGSCLLCRVDRRHWTSRTREAPPPLGGRSLTRLRGEERPAFHGDPSGSSVACLWDTCSGTRSTARGGGVCLPGARATPRAPLWSPGPTPAGRAPGPHALGDQQTTPRAPAPTTSPARPPPAPTLQVAVQTHWSTGGQIIFLIRLWCFVLFCFIFLRTYLVWVFFFFNFPIIMLEVRNIY